MMSPVFPLKKSLSTKDIESVVDAFEGLQRQGPYNRNNPYVNLLRSRAYDIGSSKANLAKAGFQLDRGEGAAKSMNVWRSPRKLVLPDRFQLRIGAYDEPELAEDFAAVFRDAFGTDEKFERNLDKMLREISANLKVVIVDHRTAGAAATGLVATLDKRSFLFCGGVRMKFRGRGLWNTLVTARQAASFEGPGHIWAMIVSTDGLIANKADESFEFLTFYKTQKS